MSNLQLVSTTLKFICVKHHSMMCHVHHKKNFKYFMFNTKPQTLHILKQGHLCLSPLKVLTHICSLMVSLNIKVHACSLHCGINYSFCFQLMGSIQILLQRWLQVFMRLQALMSCPILLRLSCIYLQTASSSAATLLEATHVLVLVDINWPPMENLV